MPTSQKTSGARTETRDTITSVERAFWIIDLIAASPRGLSLAEIARQLHVNKAIADKLLITLLKIGFVWRDDRTQTFYLTYRVSNLGMKQLQHAHLLDLCTTEVRQMADETGDLARLAIVEGGSSIAWVYAAVGRTRTLQIDPNCSLRVDLHAHATGKAWLSTMPFERAWALIEKQGVPRLTPHTITDKRELQAELADIAARGFAISREESEVGVGAIAAPILAATLSEGKECVGCVSLAAPASLMTHDRFAMLAPHVIRTASSLGQQWPLDERTRYL